MCRIWISDLKFVVNKIMKIKVLEITDEFVFVRKPFGLPTTYKNDEDNSDCAVKQVTELHPELLKVLGYKEREGGLLYRLDNDTAGLLIFCRKNGIFNQYKELQDRDMLFKRYVAVVDKTSKWKPDFLLFDYSFEEINTIFCDKSYTELNPFVEFNNSIKNGLFSRINFMIIHGRKSKKRMEVIKNRVSDKYITFFRKIDEKNNKLMLEILIQKGIRHQIRVHLKSIGLPIVNDQLYNREYAIDGQEMGLYCCGLLTSMQ